MPFSPPRDIRPMRDTLIVGGGPAGLAPLLAAGAMGGLSEMLAGGLAIVEQGPAIGSGRLGAYEVMTDGPASGFVATLAGQTHPLLAALTAHPAAQRLAAAGRVTVPLAWVAALQDAIGAALTQIMAQSGASLLTGHVALGATRLADGGWSTRIRRLADGTESVLHSRRLVLATGGHQPAARLSAERVAGLHLSPRFADRLIQSDVLLSARVPPLRLEQSDRPHIAVIGAGPSALALTRRWLAEGRTVALLHRNDTAPLLRHQALTVLSLGEDDALARGLLDAAGLVVAALGYRPRALKLVDSNGQDIRLLAERAGQPLVDGQCRVLDQRSRPVRDLFGLGLAAGFVPAIANASPGSAAPGNSLAAWQTEAAPRLARALLDAPGAMPLPAPLLSLPPLGALRVAQA